jgi:hypothetical protein
MGALDAVKQFFGLESGLGGFNAELTRLATRHAELGEERDQLLTAWPTRADVAASVPALIAERRAALWTALAPQLLPALGGRLEWVTPDGKVTRVPPHLPPALMHMAPGDWSALFEPDRLGAALVGLAPDGGQTLEQRLARIAAIDAERSRIEGEHETLIDRAGELGMKHSHLAVTRARRQAAQNEAEREAHTRHDEEYHERVRYR